MQIILHLLQEFRLIFRKFIERFKDKTPPEEWRNGEEGDVLLIPGFASTWVMLRGIGNFLNEKGYRVHNVTSIEPNTYTIEECVIEITKYIRKNKLKNIIIVAHSKGGIVTRALFANPLVAKKIKLAFTIGAPNKGTIWGYAKVKNLHELKYTSDVLTKLPTSPKIINIYSKTDQNVIPKKNLELDGSTNIEIDIVGHTRILESVETQNTIEKYIEGN